MTEPVRVENVYGAWELVSYEVRGSDGELLDHPLGVEPVGIIQYTADGYMSAQLMRRDRPPYEHPDPGGGTPSQTIAAARSYLAYAGPFHLDEATATFHHDVVVSLLPNWIGHPQIRDGRIEMGRLILSADTTHDGTPACATLTWRRPLR
ncbi:hypothetical protein MMAD_09450 [Mycolicibacterium madagascariense]|uniref:Lipocalin-like domain-containing protein n=1 Tax=Mycolicibacterium madagascariense TaxID=212765 RepID=A0A7I7XBF7_9MYCO|nr:lipocalin-like domain-containing protein [Mycolicibacterium madagascariense]MCV7014940.1 lipocalin-like domain-containing protein [Mycolicibacterium madagascariense]BBZ26650.1 hypothetical protein MMAD_09450 [Mycolicibacterium madagascariense]